VVLKQGSLSEGSSAVRGPECSRLEGRLGLYMKGGPLEKFIQDPRKSPLRFTLRWGQHGRFGEKKKRGALLLDEAESELKRKAHINGKIPRESLK